MTETTSPVPQQTFPGQAATPEGPADLTVTYLVHHGLRRDLDDFCRAVPRTPVDDRRAWRALATRWDHLSVVLHQHQHEEDAYLWPFLLERVDGEGRAVLAAMEGEHADLRPTLQACAAGFARLSEHPDDGARAALAVRLASARENLRSHLEREEEDAFALVQQLLSGQEWAELQARFVHGLPLGFWLRAVPWSMHKVPAECRAEVLRRAPAAQRLLWWATRRRFERLDRAAFAHLA